MRDALLASWREVGDKIVALAEEFPAEKYEFRPAPGTRSFADQLRHLAFWNDWVRDSLAGGQPDGQANELPRDATRPGTASSPRSATASSGSPRLSTATAARNSMTRSSLCWPRSSSTAASTTASSSSIPA
jgi:hypothetical protein